MDRFGDSEIGVFERIALSKIKHSRKMVRDATGDLGELVASIRDNGLLEPLVVRPVGDHYEVVAGNRRLEACRKLHKKRVACHIIAMDEVTSYEESLVENLQRKMMDPLEEAMAFKKYVDDYGFGGMSQLARKICKSQSYVSRRVALLDLPDEVRKQISDGRLSSVVAQELIPLHKEDADSLLEMMLENELSRDEVRAIARSVKMKPDNPLSFGPLSSFEDGVENPHLDRILNKAMTTMRVCMTRTDDTISSLTDEDDDWVVREALVDCRRTMHAMLDRLIRLRVNSRKKGVQPSQRPGRAQEAPRQQEDGHEPTRQHHQHYHPVKPIDARQSV